MRLAKSLGGVISGEHGIGITKLEYLEPAEIEAFRAYKEAVDPEGRFNAGKLLAGGDLDNAYTPSFTLIGAESLILEQTDIGGIADSIKDCLRCGKCKPVCATHVPRANLLYSPRNKILADLAAHRGLPVRGADAPRRGAAALRRVRRRRRPLHGVPQVREPLPGGHRLRRRVHRHAQPAAPRRARSASIPAPAAAMLFLERHRPARRSSWRAR